MSRASSHVRQDQAKNSQSSPRHQQRKKSPGQDQKDRNEREDDQQNDNRSKDGEDEQRQTPANSHSLPLPLQHWWWVTRDSCGMVAAGMTLLLILFAQYVVSKHLLVPWLGAWSPHLWLFQASCLLSILAHCRAQFTDPGSCALVRQPIPPARTLPDNPKIVEVTSTCRVCRIPKPMTAHHCRICRRCVVMQDHHCPYLNNCVGIFNQKFFIQFLFYIMVSCIYALALLVSRFLSCNARSTPSCRHISTLETVLFIIVFIEAIIFGLFVGVMLFEQIAAVFDPDLSEEPLYVPVDLDSGAAPSSSSFSSSSSDEKSSPPPKSYMQMIRDVFGDRVSVSWFLPIGGVPPEVIERYFRLLNDNKMLQRNLLPKERIIDDHGKY